MRSRRFIQTDVFTSQPTKGNALAVVMDGTGLSTQGMQDFATWTNLAETTFLLPPTTDDADYKVRIFSPAGEMPFAGHPTLGSCAAWLHCGGQPNVAGLVRQECGVGIVDIDITSDVPAFAAPKTEINPLEVSQLRAISEVLGFPLDRVVRTAQLNNGPNFQMIELTSAADVLAAHPQSQKRPEFRGVGLIGAHPPGSECDYEVRNLGPASSMSEDPITGSMNAAIACWMYEEGHWNSDLIIAQGTAIGRHGRVHVRKDGNTIWIGGHSHILIDGTTVL